MNIADSLEARLGSVSPTLVPVTVVIPTLNEGWQIGDTVAALAWADDVVVIDGGSTDDTVARATAAGARVIVLTGHTIGEQRNAGIDAARHPWVLALDADERATPPLQREIAGAIASSAHEAYRIRFRSFFLNRELKHGAYAGDWHVRLFRRERRYTRSKVHESLEPVADVGTLANPADHVPFRDFPHYLRKVLTYARWGADDLTARGRHVRLRDLLVRPTWRFIRDYALYGGFRDGVPGFLVSAFAGVGTLLKYTYRITEQEREDRA